MKMPIRWICLVILLTLQIWPGGGRIKLPDAIAGPRDPANLIDIVLVLDNSGSMKKNDPEFLTRDVVTEFLTGFGEKARIGMVVFDQEVRLAEPLMDLNDLQDRARFLQSLESINYGGLFSDSPAAVERAIYELKTNGREDADQVIILLTDGIVDTGDKARDIEKSRWLKEDLARESEYAGIKIFGIAFTDKADFSLIQTLAIKTGGEYFRAFKAEDIQNIFNRILTVINRPPPKVEVETAAAAEPATKPIAAVGAAEKAISKKPTAETPVPGAAASESAPSAQMAETKPRTSTPAAALPKPVPKSAGQGYLLPIILVGILILLGIVIAIQVMNRKSIPSKAAEAVVGIAEPTTGKVPGMPRAELIDIHNITGKKTQELARRQMKIGRDLSNDIIIPRDTVSSLHAVIEYRDGFFYLEDQRSKNKTLLNGVEIGPYMPRKLKNGDEITFNKFKFKFILPDSIPVGETVMDFGGKHDSMMSTATMAGPPETLTFEPAGMPQAMLIDVKNITGRKTMNLDRSIVHIGRGVHNDIVIAKEAISGTHATIEYRNRSFFLEDRRSKNKTFLNGEEIRPHKPEKLKSGDEIMFGSYKFIFLLEHQTPSGDTDESW